MTPIIRLALRQDIPIVHDMIGQLARFHGDDPTISPLVLERLLFDQMQGRVWLAQVAGVPVGYALVLERANLVTGGMGHDINHLFVVEAHRAKGVGRALIAAVRAASEDAEFLVIGTHPANLGAQAAYRAMGLEEAPLSGPRFRIRL